MLAVLFQVVFLLELHNPLPSDLALWSLSLLSVVCVAVALFARRTLTADARIRYTRDAVQPHFDTGLQYRLPGTYCVILRRKPSFPVHYPSTKNFYLNEPSADLAFTTASVENPQWRAIGVEPSKLSFRAPQGDRSNLKPDTWHVA